MWVFVKLTKLVLLLIILVRHFVEKHKHPVLVHILFFPVLQVKRVVSMILNVTVGEGVENQQLRVIIGVATPMFGVLITVAEIVVVLQVIVVVVVFVVLIVGFVVTMFVVVLKILFVVMVYFVLLMKRLVHLVD